MDRTSLPKVTSTTSHSGVKSQCGVYLTRTLHVLTVACRAHAYSHLVRTWRGVFIVTHAFHHLKFRFNAVEVRPECALLYARHFRRTFLRVSTRRSTLLLLQLGALRAFILYYVCVRTLYITRRCNNFPPRHKDFPWLVLTVQLLQLRSSPALRRTRLNIERIFHVNGTRTLQ